MDRRLEMNKLSGIILLSFIAWSAPALAQSYYYFPQIAAGSGWITELYFTNQGITAVQGISVSFYADNGSPLSVQSNVGTITNYSFNLNAGVSRVISITQASYPQGYAAVLYPGGAFVRASEVFRYKPAGTVLAEVGTSQQEDVSNHFSFPVVIDSGNGLNTGVALTNPVDVDSDQTVVLTLIKSDGSVQETALKSLGAGEHFAGFFTSLFPGVNSFSGSVSISSPWGLAVLALRQDNDAYGAIATDFGPVLTPFLLSSPVQNEQEPNNDFNHAQAISKSTIISGAIGRAGDEDYYSFSGKQGDIVSILCVADMIGSSDNMDSYVEIYDSAQDLIASNDDNGLNGTGDSFLQIALPEDGAYYIVVSNNNSYGDATCFYRLHVKLP
jgi:hypothetical protein